MKRAFPAVAIFSAVACLDLLLSQFPWAEQIELRAMDFTFQLRGPLKPPEEFLILAMDEESYGVLGIPLNEPFPRRLHADVLNALARFGPKRVIYDILFLDSSKDPEDDLRLAAAMKRVPTILAAHIFQSEGYAFEAEQLALPIPPIREAAAGLGLAGYPEQDGYIRNFLTRLGESGRNYPPLAQAAAASEKGPNPRALINYYGPSSSIPTIPIYQVLENEHPLSSRVLSNKIVFVGVSTMRTELGPAQKDSYLTPFGRMPGVEIHATAASNLFRKEWIRRAGPLAEMALKALAAGGVGLLFFTLAPVRGAILLLLLFPCWLLGSLAGLANGYFMSGASALVFTLPAAYFCSTSYYYTVAKRQHRQLRRAFQFYLSPEMVRRVTDNPQNVKLGGEHILATALFTDIKGFTSIAEKMPPGDVASMLNEYFSVLGEVIMLRKGTLVKFIGDAVFAIWGAPIPLEDHAALACRAALEMQSEIARFNSTFRHPELHTRIGIHTGPMYVGNLGSSRRFDYTAIGDTVNLASRVENLNKLFGTDILVTQTVRSSLPDVFATIEMGHIRVVGKSGSVALHALLAKACDPLAARHWRDGLAAFSSQDWMAAKTALALAAALDSFFSKAAEFYLDQIDFFSESAPPPHWRGEITANSK